MKKLCLLSIMILCMLSAVGCMSTKENLSVELDQASYDLGIEKCKDVMKGNKNVKVSDIVDSVIEVSTSKKINDEASFIDGFIDTMYNEYDKPLKKYVNGEARDYNILDAKQRIFDLVIIRPESNYELKDVVESLKAIALDDIIYNKDFTISYGRDEITAELREDVIDENGEPMPTENGIIGIDILSPEQDVVGVLAYNVNTGEYKVMINKDAK